MLSTGPGADSESLKNSLNTNSLEWGLVLTFVFVQSDKFEETCTSNELESSQLSSTSEPTIAMFSTGDSVEPAASALSPIPFPSASVVSLGSLGNASISSVTPSSSKSVSVLLSFHTLIVKPVCCDTPIPVGASPVTSPIDKLSPSI